MSKTVFYILFSQIRSKKKCKYVLARVGDAGLIIAALDQKNLLQGNVRNIVTILHNKEYLKSEDGEYELGM